MWVPKIQLGWPGDLVQTKNTCCCSRRVKAVACKLFIIGFFLSHKGGIFSILLNYEKSGIIIYIKKRVKKILLY